MNFVEEIQGNILMYFLTTLRHFEALFCLFKNVPGLRFQSIQLGFISSWLEPVTACFILFRFAQHVV